jgi:hypothetical protein
LIDEWSECDVEEVVTIKTSNEQEKSENIAVTGFSHIFPSLPFTFLLLFSHLMPIDRHDIALRGERAQPALLINRVLSNKKLSHTHTHTNCLKLSNFSFPFRSEFFFCCDKDLSMTVRLFAVIAV